MLVFFLQKGDHFFVAFGAALGIEAFGRICFTCSGLGVLSLLRHFGVTFKTAHFTMGRGVKPLGLYEPARLAGAATAISPKRTGSTTIKYFNLLPTENQHSIHEGSFF